VAEQDHSFSAQVKEELSHLQPAQACCQRMELAALLRACGRIAISGGGRLALSFATDHSPVARKVIRVLRSTFQLETEVMVGRRIKLRKNRTYLVRVGPQPGLMNLLSITGIVDEEGHLTDWGSLSDLAQDHCRRAYLRGTFLGTGWVSSPERQHHLEFTTTETEAADALGQMLFGYGIPVRMTYRKDTTVLYIKDAEQVVRFLVVVGAHQSVLQYEQVRAIKDMRNRVNRQVNAETANLAKTAEAAARQAEALERLRRSGELERLPAPLQELAALRVEHPDASLKELGEMCHPPVGKSGVAHRMRQLMALAESQGFA
jgi:cell division protein WhiA